MKLVPLHGKNGEGKFVKVNDDDFDELNQYRWYANNKGYAYRKTKILFMHREIMKTPDDLTVDHINHDLLDNQRMNLRNCTFGENMSNSRKPCTNNTGHKGVYREGRDGRFRAQMRYCGKRIWIGRFDDVNDAADAYNKLSRELRGEFHSEE
jgi:hypothetical protein